MPKEGIGREEYRTRKFGSWERSLELDASVIAVGESEGIRFAFDQIERTPNTVNAHRLIWLADHSGCQDAVVEALFRAYFSDALDFGNRQTLIDVVVQAGLAGRGAEAILDSDDGMDAIANASEMSQRYGVDAVPFFIIDQKFTFSGAQQTDVFVEAIRQRIGASSRNDCSMPRQLP